HLGLGGLAHVTEQLEVRPGEHPVLGHVRDDVAGTAGGVHAGEGLPEVAALAGPATCGERRAADVEPHGHSLAVLGDGPCRPLGVLEGGGPEVDPGAPGGQCGAEGLLVADPAAQLHLDVEAPDDVGEEVPVASYAEGRVQVHQVDPLRTGLLPAAGRLERLPELPAGAGDPLSQLDRLPAAHVDGREELQSRSPTRAHRDITQFFSRCSPASPDFSGWNCVADSAPFSTAATKGAPCRAHVTSGAAAANAPSAAGRSQVRAA